MTFKSIHFHKENYIITTKPTSISSWYLFISSSQYLLQFISFLQSAHTPLLSTSGTSQKSMLKTTIWWVGLLLVDDFPPTLKYSYSSLMSKEDLYVLINRLIPSRLFRSTLTTLLATPLSMPIVFIYDKEGIPSLLVCHWSSGFVHHLVQLVVLFHSLRSPSDDHRVSSSIQAVYFSSSSHSVDCKLHSQDWSNSILPPPKVA